MIIDCHTHLDCRDTETDFTDTSQASATVDVSIILAAAGTSGKANKQTNLALAEYAAKEPDKTIGFGVVNPLTDDISDKHWADLQVKKAIRPKNRSNRL